MKTTRNLVAKHARTFNKPTIQVDRKKAARKGYTKHKKPGASGLFSARQKNGGLSPTPLSRPWSRSSH
jgi:hypothetical protein